MARQKRIVACCALAAAFCCGGGAFAQTTDVHGYILDPNWYAWHPQLTSPQVFGTGMYEYGVGGSRGGDEGVGFYASTESTPDNYYWGIYGYFRKPNMGVGSWNLGTWSRWWRPGLIFHTEYPWTLPSKPIIRLHANMFSYGASWPGNVPTPGTGPWNEIGQTFVATGKSVSHVDIRSPLAGINVTATIHDGGPAGSQIGPARTFTSPSGPSDVRLFYSGDDVPTVPGQTYCLKLKAAGITRALFCESEPIPDWSDPMPNGCVYHDGVPDQSRDLGLTIGSDDDGILTDLNIDKSSSYPALVTAAGQTFMARGTSLVYFAGYFPDHSLDYVATLYNGISGGVPGSKIGFSKRNAYTRYADPETIFVWEPNECPLTPGNTYYIEVTRASGGQFQFTGASSNTYNGGQCYVQRTPTSWDMAGSIMEEEAPFSATRPTVKIPISPTVPGVAPADRGARSLTVRWTTDVPSDSTVEYGAWNANYTDTYYSSALVTSHAATLTGLQPNTMYHMRVKSAASLHNTGVSRDFVACTTNEAPNLLANPGFEEGSGSSPRIIPSPPWYYGGMDMKASNGSWFGELPPYAGNWLFEAAVNGSTCDGWLYQSVPAIPGVDYGFTVAMWSQMLENGKLKYDVWYNEQRVDYVKIGIDPTGGTDRYSTNIVWTPTIYSQQHYTNFGTHAVATANQITVFVSMVGRGGFGNTWHIYGIDDCRLSGNYPEAIPIAALKGETQDGLVSVGDVIITAVPSEVGAYYAEDADRTQGIRIQSAQAVASGSRVSVTGTLTTDPNTHERYLANAGFTSSAADTVPKPLEMQCKSLGGAAFGTQIPAVPGSVGPHNTGLLVTVCGTVMVKAGDSSYVYLNDGSLPDPGVKIDTSSVPSGSVPSVGQVVSMQGISSLWRDGPIVRPMVRTRRASDISGPFAP